MLHFLEEKKITDTSRDRNSILCVESNDEITYSNEPIMKGMKKEKRYFLMILLPTLVKIVAGIILLIQNAIVKKKLPQPEIEPKIIKLKINYIYSLFCLILH